MQTRSLATKGKGVRVTILQDDEPRLEALTQSTGLAISAALTIILSAGLRALEETDYKLSLPLKMKVVKQ